MSDTSGIGGIVAKLQSLFFDDAAAASFQQDPQKWIVDNGLESASYADINEAAVLACDGPINQGAVVTGGQATATVVPQVASSTTTAPSPADAPSSPSSPSAPIAVTPPPPPPPPPADMPPAEAVSQIVNYYVTEVHSTTQVDDRDTFTDNSVVNNVNAEHGAHVDITNDNDTVTASGDGAVAGGEDSDFEGVATGDGAVAAGDDIDGNVNTGTNTGVIGDDADIDDSIFGDGNTQVNDTEGTAVVGDGNIVATEGGQAAGGNITDNDITVTDSDLDGSNVGGVGNTAVQDNDDIHQDNDTTTTIVDVDTTLDHSVNDSYNDTDVEANDYSVQDSFNPEDSFNTEQSYESLHQESVDVQVVDETPEPDFHP